ncbi:MAG TPA: hypothetical protein VKZ43_01665 [Trueperaceae bacterium]|nr:hypothetical protein [Trueperaceae bacterium]
MATLRLVYVLAFMAQVLVAALVATFVRALAGGPPRPSDVLAWVLVALAVMQLPFAALMASRLGAVTSRQAALARTLFTAVILAATAWSTALALATGQRGLSVYVLLSTVMLAYALGFLAVSRLAGRAAELPPRHADKDGTGGDGKPAGATTTQPS